MKALLSLLLSFACATSLCAQTIPASAGEVLSSSLIRRGAAGDQFGRSADVIGDLNGDGVDDLVVGASSSDDGALNAGSVWILFMQAGGGVASAQKISATSGGLTAPINADNQFGKSVEGIGDLDGDGVLDIVVGAPSNTTPADRAVYTLFLNPDGTVKSWGRISKTTNGFGRALTNMGDFDGDGINDIMIGSGQGRAWLYYLNADGTEKSSRTYFARNDSSAGFPNFYGIGMNAIGDWDGDGVTDLLIGDTGNDFGGIDLGVMFLSLVNPTGFPKVEIPIHDGLPNFNLGLANYPNFGRDACVIGDLDGNGAQEIAIACSEWEGAGDPLDSGAVFVAFMQLDGSILDYRLISNSSGNLGQTLVAGVEFGTCVSPIGDINGDGVQDIAVGARFGGPGGLYILLMNDGSQAALMARGSASVISGNLPLDVQFTDGSSGNVVAWGWEFGDGTASNLPSPAHTYTTQGSYTVSLRVMDGTGATSVFVLPNTIDVGPSLDVTAGFTSNTGLGVVPLSVSFTDTSVGIVDDYLWDFGDGSTSTLQNPSHLYAAVGVFDVSLSVSNSAEADTLLQPGWVTVQAPAPTAAFSLDVSSGLSPLLVNFSDQSSDLPTSWLWDFGDGGSSTMQNPTHSFITGTYSVSLVATNSTGSDSLTQVDLVTVQPPAPLANFSADSLGGGLPLVVQFTDLSTLLPTAWAWDFGDGNLSTSQHPQHTYLSSGSYSVSLLVSNSSGSDSFALPTPIIVVAAVPVASFSADSSGGEAPLTVQFSDTSSAEPHTWLWDFGDGNTSAEQNPSHIYTLAGDYIVSLTAGNPLGSDTSLAPTPIMVIPPSPVASFVADSVGGVLPVSVSFADTSLNLPTSWAWDFGDANSSTLQNPVHVYNAPGNYVVTLDATNNSGSSHFDAPEPIVILPIPPTADFVADVFDGQTPLSVQFTDLTTLGPTQWLWKFGDGSTSTLQNPSHVYTEPGVYSVVLKVLAPTGKDTERKPAYILPGLVTGFGNGLFEDSLPPGTVPLPWTGVWGAAGVLSGPKLSQRSMPSQGSQWLQVSGQGTSNSKPPANPGGISDPARGANQIRQSFLLPKGRYGLSFDAVFELNGPLASSEFNDWMSVDVSDGQSTVNLFYRDSFSSFGPPSQNSGFPSTPLESVRVNLARVFPHARGGTPMTVSINVGNGGDDQTPSLANVDNFRLRVRQQLQLFGSELNPVGSMRVSGAARLGGTVHFLMDNPLGTQCADSTSVELFISTQPDAAFPHGSLLPGFGMGPFGGESLIEWKASVYRFVRLPASPWGGPGNSARVRLQIPMQTALVGMELYAQGLFLDNSKNCGTHFGLTQAVRIVIGP